MKKINCILVILIMFLSLNTTFAQPDNRLRQPHRNNQFEVLLYTYPDQHHSITEPTAILEFQEMAQRNAFGLTWTNINRRFNDKALEQFDVIVFLQSTTRDLSAEQLESFKRFIRNGGGFVGIHGAVSYYINKDIGQASEDEWYHKLVGRILTTHPPIQTAVMHVVDKKHPSTMHLPDMWLWTEEWYSFGEALTDNLKVLITLDESTILDDSTYDPISWAMGDSYPIAWYHEYDGGRSFYTALGHLPASFKDPWFLDHIYGAIYWAATGLGVYK